MKHFNLRNILIILLLGAVVLPTMAANFPKNSPNFAPDLAQVLQQSKISGKPVVAVFSASWCPPCQQMKRSVYPDRRIQKLHDSFEWAYIDVDDPKNTADAAKFNVQGIPHIQFLKADGSPVSSQVGGMDASSFERLLKSIKTKAAK